jgi:protein ImuA
MLIQEQAGRNKIKVIEELQADILRLQGLKTVNSSSLDIGLGPLRYAFPGSFPLTAVHEFLTPAPEDTAASIGFISALLSFVIPTHAALLWVGTSRKLFPPAFKQFGLPPHHIIFIDASKEKDVLWVMEEALKCAAVTAVIGEMPEISFTASRKLQLAVEQSNATGFILRKNCHHLNTTACVSRWRITSLPSESIDDLPGVGFPQWKVELLRIRNGKSGVWNIRWQGGRFQHLPAWPLPNEEQKKKAG